MLTNASMSIKHVHKDALRVSVQMLFISNNNKNKILWDISFVVTGGESFCLSSLLLQKVLPKYECRP